MKRARERIRRFRNRGRRKLSRGTLVTFPHEIIAVFAHLPRVFRKIDVDRLLGDKISRSMKWRYLKRMERLGLIRHATKRYYRKLYDKVSDWMERDLIPKVRLTESNLDRTKL